MSHAFLANFGAFLFAPCGVSSISDRIRQRRWGRRKTNSCWWCCCSCCKHAHKRGQHTHRKGNEGKKSRTRL